MSDHASRPLFKRTSIAFPPADRIGAVVNHYHSPHQQLYGLDVYFVGDVPANATIDGVLRGCLALAVAHDASLNIYVDAYRLPHRDADPGGRTALSPYGRDHFLCFDARLRQIGIRRVGRKGFVDHPSSIGEPAEEEDAIDDATDDMRGQVAARIWYGYHSAEAIGRWIDERAACGDAFDVAWIRTFAQHELACKRAAEAAWPAETDCDRLDRAFDHLRAQGFCALAWAGDTLDDGFERVSEVINADDLPADRYTTGFCFFHSQDMDHALDGAGLSVAFGHVAPDSDEDDVLMGRRVVRALQQAGLQPVWNGSPDQRIALPTLQWQRRTPAD